MRQAKQSDPKVRRHDRQLAQFLSGKTLTDRKVAQDLLQRFQVNGNLRSVDCETGLRVGEFTSLDKTRRGSVIAELTSLTISQLGAESTRKVIEWLRHMSATVPHYMPVYSLGNEVITEIRSKDLEIADSMSLRFFDLELFALQTRVLMRGQSEEILAHGIKPSTGGLLTFADIILEGRIIDRFTENQTPYLGTLAMGNPVTTSGQYGPYFVLVSDDVKFRYVVPNLVQSTPGTGFFGPIYSEFHELYLVPTQQQKDALTKALGIAVEKGLITKIESVEISLKIKTYEEFLNSP